MRDAILYECGICSSYHEWEWSGDCRDDANRFASPEDYEQRTGKRVGQIHTMDERVEADSRA